jgi:6-pyruvoyltetrahydropterin/6-carboxytetrahydropterin synthase
MIILTKRFKFCAAHRYRNAQWSEEKNASVFGDDSKIHGHNYDLEVSLTGPVDPETGFIADLGKVKNLVNERVIRVLDHTQIDEDVPWFKNRQPSSENLVTFIWEQLVSHIPEGVQLVRVRLYETPTIYAEYNGT